MPPVSCAKAVKLEKAETKIKKIEIFTNFIVLIEKDER
jgi:hypothetical protein